MSHLGGLCVSAYVVGVKGVGNMGRVCMCLRPTFPRSAEKVDCLMSRLGSLSTFSFGLGCWVGLR